MRKTLSLLLPLCAALCLILLALWMTGVFASGVVGPGLDSPPAGLASPAHSLELRPRSIPRFYEAVGTVQPRLRAMLAAQSPGNILEVLVEVGARVQRGDLLLRIDGEQHRARLEQARSHLRASEAALLEAHNHWQRTRELHAQGAATQQRLEAAASTHEQAQASVSAAQERIREAEILLSYSELHAPIDGIVSERLVDPGDLAWSGRNLISLYAPEAMRLEASVREGLIDRVEPGSTATVRIAASRQSLEGSIEDILPHADPKSRSFIVRVALPASEGLYPGLFGHLLLAIEERESLLVPRQALRQVGQLTTVQVQDAEGLWQRRLVTLGAVHEDAVEVLSGLRAGEMIGWDL